MLKRCGLCKLPLEKRHLLLSVCQCGGPSQYHPSAPPVCVATVPGTVWAPALLSWSSESGGEPEAVGNWHSSAVRLDLQQGAPRGKPSCDVVWITFQKDGSGCGVERRLGKGTIKICISF